MQQQIIDRGTRSLRRVAIACGIGFFSLCAAIKGQELMLQQRAIDAPRAIGVARPAGAEKEDAELNKESDLDNTKFANGAALKTDPELERLLKRADQFALDGRYDLATVLWQKVLDESGDTLMLARRPVDERDLPMYTSLSAEVERTLAKLPLDGLKLYRISADGEANAIMAQIQQGMDEEEALSKVVRRYFMSSLGDDAAYKLGCIALDRHDFVGASRMFQAIIDQHPDPSMPRADVLLRLAVASAKVGDSSATAQSLTALDKATGERPSHDTISAVKTFVARVDKNATQSAQSGKQWLVEFGNPSRTGRMKGLPAAAVEADLAELWTQEFDIALPQVLNDPRFNQLRGRRGVVMMAGGFGGRVITQQAGIQQQQDSRVSLVERWRKEGWFPTARLLFDGDAQNGRVFVKTATELTCWDTNCESNEPIWRTAWLNFYQPDSATQNFAQMMMNQGVSMAQQGPSTLAEINHFGDRVHNSISISGDLIFNLEGKRVPRSGGMVEQDPPKNNGGWGYGTVPRRARQNFLAAYGTRTGKVVWYRSADDTEKDSPNGKTATDIGFLAAPTPYGNLLLTPVTDGGTIWLYALSQTDGKTVWKTYLCDEPQGGASQWSTVGISVDGRDAYVCCGTGAVFALDAVSGAIRWAVRYQRTGKPSQRMVNVYGMQNSLLDFEGWQDDVVIPFGKLLVVMPSDFNTMFAIDRRTGEFAWHSPQDGATYCIGVVGRSLYVAGRDSIRKIDIPTGLLKAHRLLNTEPRQSDALAYGRGCVTEDAVYLPVKDSVLKLRLEDLADVSQVGVSSTSGDPVGNLFSDGEKLWVAGPSKISALTNLDRRLAELSTKIAAGDAGAQLVRMRMQRIRGKLDEAIADLEGAYKLLLAKDRFVAARTVTDGVKELGLAADRPLVALKFLADAYVSPEGDAIDFLVGKTSEEDRTPINDVYSRRAELTNAALLSIRNSKVKNSVEPILRLAPTFDQEYLLHAARKTIGTVATSEDAGVLVAALEAKSPLVVAIAADGLGRAQGDAAKEPLTKLLSSPHDKVKLAAGSALLNIGERSGLAPLVALLESADERVASQASARLRSASGKVVAFSPTDPELRKSGIAEWKAWLESDGMTAKLTYPLPDSDPMLGRTLVCYYAQGRVVEYDEQYKERASRQVQGVWGGQGLPNGNRLLALYALRKVVEYDENWNEVWSIDKDQLPGSPFNVRRLPNGNTLVACSDSQRVLEFDRSKKVVWDITVQGRPMDATRLENGNTLISLSHTGRVVEYSPDKREVWSVDRMAGAMSAERLENGNTLIACTGGGRNGTGMVVEIDTNKKEVWKIENLRSPYDAQRLPNGNTLITDNQSVQEVNTKQEVKWKVDANGASSGHRF